jgi:hypothetical protein
MFTGVRPAGRYDSPRGCGFGPHRRVGGNGNGRRREGARGSGGDRCGATKGAEMRERGEQRARCGEAEARGAFYRDGEAVGSRGGGRRRWSFNPRQF